MKNNKVSVIVVNYNCSALIDDLLDSIFQIKEIDWEIIVVDNASPNDQIDWLKGKYPTIMLIKSPSNKGFAAGNNLGIAAATGDYLLFLNPDTVVTANFIFPLLTCLKQDKKIGLVSPKIKYYDQPDRIQYAGCRPMHRITLQAKPIGKNQLDDGQYDGINNTAYGHGAAMMIRREIIEKVGLLNEQYFLYYEELDWCQRIKKAGYQIQYVGTAVVWHKESVATGKNSPLKTYYLTRNRLLFARLHIRGGLTLAYSLYFLLIAIPKNIWVNRRSRLHLKAYFRGLLWNLYNRPI